MESAAGILDSIRKIVRALRVSSRATEKELGLSGAQLFVLQKLRGDEALSINELAYLTLTHQSSVSVVVGRLFEQGLVRRRTAKTDGRRLEIFLSAKGQALLARTPITPQERLINAISGLSVAQQSSLAVVLETVVEASGFSQGPAPLFFEDEERVSKRRKAKDQSKSRSNKGK